MARTTRRDDVDQEKAKAKKVARTLTRLKFSLAADDVLNDLIPDIDEAVDNALIDGTGWEYDVMSLVKNALEAAMPALTDSK